MMFRNIKSGHKMKVFYIVITKQILLDIIYFAFKKKIVQMHLNCTKKSLKINQKRTKMYKNNYFTQITCKFHNFLFNYLPQSCHLQTNKANR